MGKERNPADEKHRVESANYQEAWLSDQKFNDFFKEICYASLG